MLSFDISLLPETKCAKDCAIVVQFIINCFKKQVALVGGIFIGVVGFDRLDFYVSRAEVAYKEGRVRDALREAGRALSVGERDNNVSEKVRVAIRIFIARCHSKLGDFASSNAIYRELIREEVYLAPVIMGLLHNNLRFAGERKAEEKAGRNIALIKIFVGGEVGGDGGGVCSD